MREKIESTIARSRADYTEIRLETTQSTLIHTHRGHREPVALGTDRGGIVRCLLKDRGWGVVSFNDSSDLDREVAAAYDCARVGNADEPIELAPVPAAQAEFRAELPDDSRGRSVEDKVALAERYRDILKSHDPRIVDCSIYYGDRFVTRTFANSEGSYIHGDHPRVFCVARAVARENGELQSAWNGLGGPRDFAFVNAMDTEVEAVARMATDLLVAKPVEAGRYPVIMDPELTGLFIHEAFGHLSEADHLIGDPKAEELMTLGRQVGSKQLNVFDDGTLVELDGGLRFDDEGTPGKRTVLVEDGILVGRLHSRATGAHFGEEPTGNARAMDYRHPPIVRMTNTAVSAGEAKLDDMIAGIDLGILACGGAGGMTAKESFTFGSTHAYMIRNGRVAELVRPVSLTGNLFETLHAIDAVADDFAWVRQAGGCGKQGQVPLPVDLGGPHVRIPNLQVGTQ